MIDAYNRSRIVQGILLLAGGLVCYGLSWLFFYYGLGYAADAFDWPPRIVPWLAAAALAGITWSGCRHAKKGGGFAAFSESALFHDLGAASGGAVMMNYEIKKVTGPAYVLTQICLGGPLLVLRGISQFREMLPDEAGLETKLGHVLTVLRAANKWQSIEEYPHLRREILMLARMKKIDFSAHKGTPRIKATPADGTQL